MRVLTATFAVTLIASPALAQTPTITPPQAKDHVGEIVTVEGEVSEVHHAASGKAIFLDMGGRYPNNPFAGVIFSRDAAQFPAVDSFTGKTVDITGRVKLYNGSPEIILNEPGQIKIKH